MIENEIALCVKSGDTQDYESAVFSYLSVCYYIKFEHICQAFGAEPSWDRFFPHTELFFGAVRRFLCIAPQYLKKDLYHTEQIKPENFYL